MAIHDVDRSKLNTRRIFQEVKVDRITCIVYIYLSPAIFIVHVCPLNRFNKQRNWAVCVHSNSDKMGDDVGGERGGEGEVR